MRSYTADGQIHLEHEGEDYIADVRMEIMFSKDEWGWDVTQKVAEIIQIVRNDKEGQIVYTPSESLKDAVYASAEEVIFYDEG